MPKRTEGQKIGAQGHKWLSAHVEENSSWLARDLSEDFGIDAEWELTEPEVRGEILKIQIKTSEQVEKDGNFVKFTIEKSHLKYAESCRYPFILVRVDLESHEAWYLWLQDWLLKKRSSGSSPLHSNQASWAEWVPKEKTVARGLRKELKEIARWEGQSQLALSLADAMRAAAAIHDTEITVQLAEILATCAQGLDQSGLNTVIDEAIRLGVQMRGTPQGNEVATKLFAMVRRCGGRVDVCTVDRLVLRGDSYSRTGLTCLALMYDDHFEHIASLGLPHRYTELEPRVAYYCAFREAHPEHHSSNIFVDPSAFNFAGLAYYQPDSFWEKYANRGPSALLDHLGPQ